MLSSNTYSNDRFSNLPDCQSNEEVWHNCQGARTYDNTSTYTGEWQNNSYNGKGILVLPGTFFYNGEFIHESKDFNEYLEKAASSERLKVLQKSMLEIL